ncbi:hypothetical protein HUT18_11765 [Streptomyces sp. NA04227]|uniref:hypothetical protein n=1 Tax=Streptomyces sp. NA04227 TaxID=2742136 RepID=UPI0015908FC5|nr:hypothetical protein [Streptomyces sp. NA04227]QKW06975.1 hypothetical protein HUT18_11765 [Streptomyces sp. NA04227]
MTGNRPLHERANVHPARLGKGLLAHYAHDTGMGLCGRPTIRRLTVEEIEATDRFCGVCVTVARRMADERERYAEAATREAIAAHRQEANEAAARVRTDPDPASQDWREALARLGAALDYLRAHDPVYADALANGDTERRAMTFQRDHADRVRAAVNALTDGKEGAFPELSHRLAMAPDGELDLTVRIFTDNDEDAEPDATGTAPDVSGQPIEGVVVQHEGTAQGCTPKHVTDPDVAAAREVLSGLAYATLTDHHDISEPVDEQRNVRGYVIDPRTHGRVALYWLEGGRAVRRDDPWHGPCLDILAERMKERGWATERMLRSSRCVFAHRPDVKVPKAANH